MTYLQLCANNTLNGAEKIAFQAVGTGYEKKIIIGNPA